MLQRKIYPYILTFAVIFISQYGYSQAPEGINYQAVLRKSNGQLWSNYALTSKIEINQGNFSGPTVYAESHNSTSNNQGIVNYVIGNGTVLAGNFESIDWGLGPYYLKLSVDFNNGDGMQVYGIQQLVSVPYALHAKVADSIAGGVGGSGGGTDDQNLTGANLNGTELQIDIEDGNPAIVDLAPLQDGTGTDDQNLTGANLNGTELQIDIEDGNSATVDLSSLQDGTGTDDQNLTGANLNGTELQIDIEDGTSATVDLASLQDGTGTDDQNLTGANLNGTELQIDIEDGTSVTVDLATLQDGTGTDDQNLTGANLNGTELQIDIEDGTSVTVDLVTLQDGVDDADNDPTNEIQVLSFSNDTLYLSNGGQIYLGDYSNQILSLNDLSDASTEGVDQSFATPNDKNVFVGLGSGDNVETGYNNTALGYNTLNQLVGQTPSGNTNNRENVAIGYRSQENSRGAGNTSLGAYSLMNNTLGLTWNGFSYGGGNFNTAIGFNALRLNESGNDNVGIGYNALFNLTQGIRNIGIGQSPGQDLTSGSNNIFLGFLSGEGQTSGSYKLYIDNSEYNDPNPPLIFGEFGNGNNNEPFLDFGGDVNVFDTLTTPYFVLSDGASNGYILQSDASGNANWVDPLTVETLNDNDWALSGNDMYSLPSGNVGIGTSIPNATLEVAGSIRITNLSGTGDRMVITNSTGDLSSATIPVNTDNQTLSLSSNQLTISGGNTVNLNSLQDGDNQTLTYGNGSLSITGGNSVNISGVNTDNQTLNFNSSTNTLSISGSSSSVDLSSLAAGDNLGNHSANVNLKLNGNYISNDGGNEGIKVDNEGNITVSDKLGFNNHFAVAPYTYTKTNTVRSNISTIGDIVTTWQDEYIILGYRHAETNATNEQFLFPGIVLKDASLVDDWMFVLLGGSGGDGFSSADLGEYSIINFTTSHVTNETVKWLAPDGFFGSTIGADKQFFIEDGDWGVGSRVILIYKKNQTTATKYSPMYKLTYIASGNINSDNIDIISTIEATYHDVDPNN